MLPKIVLASLLCCPDSMRRVIISHTRLLFFLFHHYYLCNDLQNGPNLLSCYNVKRVSGYTLHKIMKISITYQHKNSLLEFNLTSLILIETANYLFTFSFHPFIVYLIFQTTKIQKQKLFLKNFCDSH